MMRNEESHMKTVKITIFWGVMRPFVCVYQDAQCHIQKTNFEGNHDWCSVPDIIRVMEWREVK
jgi:hypothetical protein